MIVHVLSYFLFPPPLLFITPVPSPEQERVDITQKIAAMVNRGCSDQEIITRLRFVPGRNKTYVLLLYSVLLLVLHARMCVFHVCAPVCNCAGCRNADTTPRACRSHTAEVLHMMSLVLPPALAFCLMQTQAATGCRFSASAQCAVRFSGEYTETCGRALIYIVGQSSRFATGLRLVRCLVYI